MIPLLTSLSLLMPAPIPPEIENEQALGVNKIPYHSTLVPYGSAAEALRADRTRSAYARSLNGDWKFHWAKRPEERPMEFYRPDYDVSAWKTIPVPSSVEAQGYGTPIYTNITYPFKSDWPRVMGEPPKDWTAYDERNPVSSYRRTFEVPADWRGRETFLKFDGVDAGFFVWVNGEKVGYSQNSRNAAEFDITKYLKPGKNDLAVEVYRYTAGSYFEDQDMWRLSGIFRNVTLWSAPKLHMQDTFLTTDLDPQYRDATLKVVAKVRNYDAIPSKPQTFRVAVSDPGGKAFGSELRGRVPAIAPGQETTVTLSGGFKSPKTWSAETPTLYTAILDLGNGSEILSHRVGFRKVEVKGRVFMVNGQPVKLKGANRHEMNPNTGHTVTEADMIEDLRMLKRANCNHVRTSHYSDDPRWYELCDEWGIYLVAEANAESHGLYNVLDREPRFERMVVDRNVANVENFKNHPSVLIWSLGNECGGGANFRAALKAIEAIDPTRATHYEPFGEGAGNPASIDSHMYTQTADLDRIANDPKLTKPMYLCEYAHAMNNSMGAMDDYNERFDKYPALMGGAIWEWEDQGLWNRRDPKWAYIAYGGGFGDVPNDHYFIHKGVVFSDRTPKPHFAEAKRTYQWISFTDLVGGKVRVKNRYSFTDLSRFDFKWTIVSDGGTVATGAIPAFSLAPGQERTLQLALPKIQAVAGRSYYLDLAATQKEDEKWAEKGYDVANAQFAMSAAPAIATVPKGTVQAQKTSDGDIQIKGGDFALTFDHATGTLSELSEGGKNILLPGGGPQLHLWRAQHRNDDNWAAGGWDNAGLKDLKPEVLGLDVVKGANGEAVVSSSVRYVGRNGFSALHLARYTVYGDGTVAVDNGVSPSDPKLTLARVGVRMLLDPGMSSLNYFARGPMENYSDRKSGSDIGRYSSTVDEEMTPYPKPQECGNHEDMKWLSLAGKNGEALVVAADGAPLQFSALPYRDEEMEDVPYRVDLPRSTATVLIVSGRTLGVGSASCGPRPSPECRLGGTPRAFSYVLRLGRDARPTALPKRGGVPILVSRGSDGRVTLSSDGPIETSTDGLAWTAYRGSLTAERPMRLGVRTAGFTGAIAVEPPPAKLAWTATASDFEASEGNPQNALDNNTSTFWHSRYSPSAVPAPHTLTVDLVKPESVGRVILTPRGDMANGRIRGYEIALSDDGKTFATVKRGELPNRGERQTVRLDAPRRARYVRLTVLSDWSNAGLATLAEFDIEP